MAIVPNKDGQGISAAGALSNVDRRYTTPNRKNAGSPAGSLTPAYAGEIVQDTTGNSLWIALDMTTTGWAPYVMDS